MPLTEKVEFKTLVQRGNRFQVPRAIRWRFKLEPDQVLKVSLYQYPSLAANWECFYTRMTKDGRITLPLLVRNLVLSRRNDEQSLAGALIRVQIEPV